MIRPIDITLNAAHPELPLVEATTFTGAPSSVFIRGVPKAVGNWSITAVSVAVTYPDNTTTARAAVESAEGVWVATIPGTATSGRTAAGFRILADGTDENGAAVTGYVLGFADFAVLSFFPVPAPGETFFYLRYFDTMPTAAKKMDVTTIDGILKYYNGTAWQPFTDLSDYYTAEQVDEAIDKLAAYYITADAQGNPFATHSALVNAQTYYSGGAVRTPTRNDYAVVSADETHGGAEWRYIYAVDAQGVGQWEPQYAVEGVIAYDNTVTPTSANGVKSSGIWSALWGALAALPTGFSSLYDWVVDQLAGKISKIENDNTNLLEGDGYGGAAPCGKSLRDFALADSLAPAFVFGHAYEVGELCTSFDADSLHYGTWLYKCIVATDGSTYPEIDPTHWTLATVEDVLAALRTALAGKADVSAIPYSLGTPTVISTASSEVVEGETVYYGAATLTDRTANIVGVAVALDELRVTIPPAISGKVRDFGLYVAVGFGEGTALAAPALVPVAPTGETITLMNAEGEMPTLADGTTTESGTTVLYFTEVANGTFLVKGEEVKEIV